METSELNRLIKTLPKAELHLHLEGAVTPAILKSLASRYSSGIAEQSVAQIKSNLFQIESRQALENLRKEISTHLRVPEDYQLVLEDLHRSMREQTIRYAEIFFCPAARWRLGQNADDILERLVDDSSRIEKEGGPKIRWILTCLRSQGPESARKTVEMAIRYRDRGVVAVGLRGESEDFSPDEYAGIFSWAKVQGLFVHVHSREKDGPKDIRQILEELGANRIGHGIQASRDPRLMQTLRERAIGLDICLSGNALTGSWKHTLSHPFSLLWKRGVPVSLNTDNPGLFGCSLSTEILQAIKYFKLSKSDLKKICLMGVSLSFLPYREKMDLMQNFNDSFDKIFITLK